MRPRDPDRVSTGCFGSRWQLVLFFNVFPTRCGRTQRTHVASSCALTSPCPTARYRAHRRGNGDAGGLHCPADCGMAAIMAAIMMEFEAVVVVRGTATPQTPDATVQESGAADNLEQLCEAAGYRSPRSCSTRVSARRSARGGRTWSTTPSERHVGLPRTWPVVLALPESVLPSLLHASRVGETMPACPQNGDHRGICVTCAAAVRIAANRRCEQGH